LNGRANYAHNLMMDFKLKEKSSPCFTLALVT